jgi:molybdopterin/thiamine biosynthesis adenylyltransferase
VLAIFAFAAALWGAGWMFDVPKRVRWNVIFALYGAVVAMHLILPDSHPLRLATGGDASGWLIFGAVVTLVALYRYGLGLLKAQVRPVEPPAQSGPFADGELDRYLRHIVLREMGGPGQVKLKQARVLVIGAGGLGSPVLQYLAAAGIGTIGVIDDDDVDQGNLQRQVIHRDTDIGTPKVFSAERAMKAINPFLNVRPYQRRLTPDMAEALFQDYDVILDGTDNFDTRYLANQTAVAQGKPLISGALSQWEGQLSIFHPAKTGPCYQCIFPQAPADGLAPSCAEAGVLGPLPGVIGSMMAVEAVKLIVGIGQDLRGEMMIYDALWGETRKITLKSRHDCPICRP